MSNILKVDIVFKDYFKNFERFADFINGALYKGKQVINPDHLELDDTEVSSVNEKELIPQMNVLFYSGDKAWKATTHIKDMFPKVIKSKDYICDFEYELLDVKELKEEQFQLEENRMLMRCTKLILENGRIIMSI